MRVLYANHTGQISGGERSLLDVLGALPDDIEPWVATPRGPLAERVEALGVPVAPLGGTERSLKLGPASAVAGGVELTRDGVALRRIAARVRPDLLHANSIRAGVAAAAARALGGPPVVAHVRDALPPQKAAKAALRVVDIGSRTIIANSRYTAERLRRTGVRGRVSVVHSPVDLDRFDPRTVERDATRASLGLADESAALGVIAQITPWKNQAAAIAILGGLRERGCDAQLLLVGSAKFASSRTRHDNPAYLRELERSCERSGLWPYVHFLGEREDVPEVLSALDVLLAPSWEEPFGRSVVEAMAMGVPVAATAVGGPAEVITDGETGLLLPPREPERWIEPVATLLASPRKRAEIASRASAYARETFGLAMHVERIAAVYEELAEVGR